MHLGYERIKELLSDDKSEIANRLIISPILDADAQLKPGSASVDLRLGHHFKVAKRTKVSHLDRMNENHSLIMHRYTDEYDVPFGEYFVLHPRQFIMGETLEWIHMPRNLAGEVSGRSSWARDGLIIATATGIHPNYSGIITLELTNIGEIPLYLYPGLSICQLFLFDVQSAGKPSPHLSTFAGATEPQAADSKSSDVEIIREFKHRLSDGAKQ